MSDTRIASCTGIDFVREGRPILQGIDWQIQPGENWAILGANGSGKTTLLRLLATQHFPTRGTLSVNGHTFGQCDLRELRKAIGWVSTVLRDRQPFGATAREIVAGGTPFSPPTTTQLADADQMLAACGCAGLGAHIFETLSQGEQQKTLIAKALLPAPRLLILDEPCAGLDMAARERFLHHLADLQHPERTMLLITHHPEEITPLFSHVLLLKEGRVLAQGPRAAVLTSAHLSDAFGMPIELHEDHQRYWVRMQPPNA